MTSTDERVEITPELLAELVEKASGVPMERWKVSQHNHEIVLDAGIGLAVARGEGPGYFARPVAALIAALSPPVVLALVQRIRELELRLAISKDALSAELGEDRVRRDNALALGRMIS